RDTEFAAYWQDTWKVNPKLTLNFGIRYELFTHQTEVYDRITNFDPVQGILLLPGKGGSHPAFSSRALMNTRKNDFAPRFGFAYKLDDKTILRSSYGLFYLAQGQAGFQLTLNPPFVGGTNYTNTATPQTINRTLDQGIPQTNPFVPINDPVGS